MATNETSIAQLKPAELLKHFTDIIDQCLLGIDPSFLQINKASLRLLTGVQPESKRWAASVKLTGSMRLYCRNAVMECKVTTNNELRLSGNVKYSVMARIALAGKLGLDPHFDVIIRPYHPPLCLVDGFLDIHGRRAGVQVKLPLSPNSWYFFCLKLNIPGLGTLSLADKGYSNVLIMNHLWDLDIRLNDYFSPKLIDALNAELVSEARAAVPNLEKANEELRRVQEQWDTRLKIAEDELVLKQGEYDHEFKKVHEGHDLTLAYNTSEKERSNVLREQAQLAFDEAQQTARTTASSPDDMRNQCQNTADAAATTLQQAQDNDTGTKSLRTVEHYLEELTAAQEITIRNAKEALESLHTSALFLAVEDASAIVDRIRSDVSDINDAELARNTADDIVEYLVRRRDPTITKHAGGPFQVRRVVVMTTLVRLTEHDKPIKLRFLGTLCGEEFVVEIKWRCDDAPGKLVRSLVRKALNFAEE